MIMSHMACAAQAAQLQEVNGPVLFIGPAYSGKSELSRKALQPHRATAVIGTAPPTEEKLMNERLLALKAMHPADALLVENASSLTEALRDVIDRGFTQILLDSLSHFIAGKVLSLGAKYDLEQMRSILMMELDEFSKQVTILSAQRAVRLLMVSSEMGASVVPRESASRFVRYMAGMFHQKMAHCCPDVFLVSCGIPLWIKAAHENQRQDSP